MTVYNIVTAWTTNVTATLVNQTLATFFTASSIHRRKSTPKLQKWTQHLEVKSGGNIQQQNLCSVFIMPVSESGVSISSLRAGVTEKTQHPTISSYIFFSN